MAGWRWGGPRQGLRKEQARGKAPGFFGISFLWDWIENVPFPSPMSTAEFSKFAGILSATFSQHHFLGFEIVQLELHYLHLLCS